MPLLFCDVESRSELDINDVGSYRYLSHPSTELILFAYAYGDEDIKIWECLETPMPEDLRRGLEDPFQIIVAHNTGFERIAFRNLLRIEIEIDRFEDTMVRGRYMSLPGSLEKMGAILDIKNKKLTEFFIKDQSMVGMFCSPLRYGGEITLFGEEKTSYRYKDTHPREWQKFCDYCVMDVEASREILKRCSKFPLPESEYKFFEISEEINDRGIYTDSVLLQGSMLIVEKEQGALYKEWFDLTGIKKPKSTKQVLGFAKLHGFTFPSIGKPFIKRALAGECQLDEIGTKALNLRLQLSKSSVSKLEACQDSVEPDGRVRGLFNFMGAARTGRWTSGLFQAHNLVKATKEIEAKQDLALELVKAGDYERIKKEFSSPIDVACSTLRPILRAPKGRKFIIADLNAIETRGAAWIAGCDTLMEVFRLGRCPYITFAAQMDPSKTYEELYADYKAGNKKARTDAKSPTLGCGYGLTAGTIERDNEGNLVKTGLLAYADNMGIELTEEYAQQAVLVYRNSYQEIVNFWWDLHRAFANAVENDATVEIGPLTLEKQGRVLNMWLPSGRALHYIDPKVVRTERTSKKGNKYKATDLFCQGIHQETHQWQEIDTRGAKLFENAVQAICRDVLAEGMINCRDAGFELVLHCHDELVAEADEDSHLTVDTMVECMTRPIKWAPGFVLGAAGFESPYYVKEA